MKNQINTLPILFTLSLSPACSGVLKICSLLIFDLGVGKGTAGWYSYFPFLNIFLYQLLVPGTKRTTIPHWPATCQRRHTMWSASKVLPALFKTTWVLKASSKGIVLPRRVTCLVTSSLNERSGDGDIPFSALASLRTDLFMSFVQGSIYIPLIIYFDDITETEYIRHVWSFTYAQAVNLKLCNSRQSTDLSELWGCPNILYILTQ